MTFRRAGLAVAAAAAALSLVGCQAGTNAQTSQDYSPVDGRNINVPADAGPRDPFVAIRGAIIVANDSGQAALLATVRNKTDETETLVSVAVDDAPGAIDGGSIVIEPGRSVAIGEPGGAQVSWSDLGVAAGTWVTLTMQFGTAGTVTRDVLVVANTGIYADVPIGIYTLS